MGSSCPNHCWVAADDSRGVSLETASSEPVPAVTGLGGSTQSCSAWPGQARGHIWGEAGLGMDG